MKSLKYILLLPVLMFALGIGIQSCSDNTDFSKPHILTDDEMAELARQQRVRDSLMSVINADSIVITQVNLIASASSYDGTTVELDYHAAAVTFGLTDEQVIQSIQNLWQEDDYMEGYPEFTAFAIENTTHSDNMGPQTQAGGFVGWGHWWNSKGDVCEWNYTNNDEAVYTSIYSDLEKGIVKVDIGQYPGQLYDGEKIRVMEALKYTDANEVVYRIVYVFDITVGELGDIEGDVVATKDIEGSIDYNGNYETSDIPVDIEEIVGLLGAPSWENVTWVALNPDGSYFQEMDASDGRGNGGFWFGQDGYKGGWGDSASVFMCFPTDEYVEAFSAAPMPGVFIEGSVVTIHCAASYEGTGKIVELNVTITVGAAASMDGEEAYSKTYDVKQAFRDDYSYSLLPLDADAICSALGISNLNEAKVVGYDAEGNLIRDYTAGGVGGFWYLLDGSVGAWGEAVMFIEYHGDGNPESEAYNNLRVGIHPELYDREYVDGTVVPVQIGFYGNDKLAMLTVNWQIGEEDEGFGVATDWNEVINAAEDVLNIEVSMDCPVNIPYESGIYEFDMDKVMTALGITSMNQVMPFARIADGTDVYQGDDPAYWFGSTGNLDGWGPNGRVYIAYYGYDDEFPEDEYSLYVGLMESPFGEDITCETGDVYTPIYGLYANNKKVTFSFTITVTDPVELDEPETRGNSFQPSYKTLKTLAHRNR